MPSTAYYRLKGDSEFNSGGIDFFSEDWDNAIILDACRNDIFQDTVELPGEFDKKVSKGSSTSEFVRANFKGKNLYDTIYISGNSWFKRLKDDISSEVHTLFEVSGENNSNKLKKTVDCVKYCQEEYPNKRLLIHFIPPHHPLLGSTADSNLPSEDEQLAKPFYERIRKGEIDIEDEDLYKAYVENLERVMPHVKELLSVLDGKTVVTSDHGEMLGERAYPIPFRFYGHIPGVYTDELVNIPWYTHPYDHRKNIIEENSGNKINRMFSEDGRNVKEKLEDLGYSV